MQSYFDCLRNIFFKISRKDSGKYLDSQFFQEISQFSRGLKNILYVRWSFA